MRIAVDAAPFVVLPGPDFDFSLIVESVMPARGVSIEFKIEGEKDGNNYYYSPPVKTQANRTALRAQYVPRQVMCLCTVKVVSEGDPRNFASTSFRLVYK